MKKVYNLFCRFEKILAMAAILLMTIFIFLGAVSRAMGHPFSWTTDLGTFMLAWATFLGGDIAFREGRLANLDILLGKLPVRVQKVIGSIIYAIVLVFLACLVYYGAKLTYSSRFRTFNGVQGFSYSWVTMCMPVTGAFMAITTIGRMKNLLMETDPKKTAKL